MFKRKKPKSIKHKFLELLWPRQGWKRYGRYLLLRLSRLKGSPHAIAVGFACGAAISFTPFVGLHLTLGAITAFLFGGNIIASAIGTIVGNPWTFPFIWMGILKTGEIILKVHPDFNGGFAHVFGKATKALITLDFSAFFVDVWPVFFPMLVGSVPFYILTFVISYFLIKRLVYRIETVRKRAKK